MCIFTLFYNKISQHTNIFRLEAKKHRPAANNTSATPNNNSLRFN